MAEAAQSRDAARSVRACEPIRRWKRLLLRSCSYVALHRAMPPVLIVAGLLAAGQARANPQGGTVVSGSASIVQTSPTRLDINQSTSSAIIDWRSFNIAPGEWTNFNQPSAAATTLNRVTGSQASVLQGQLTANGRVVLVNPNGVFISRSATINVGGLLATTSDISNQNFMAGNWTFDKPGKPDASIVNEGRVTVADAGLAAFVAPRVANSGVIEARLGSVSLASGNKFTVDLYGDGLVNLAVDDSVAQKIQGARVDNSGKISANGGTVLLTASAASDIVDNLINVGGTIEARTASMQNGKIILQGTGGTVAVSGTLDASGRRAGETGGTVEVLGGAVNVGAGAKIDASGTAGGGTVLIGGNFHGAGPQENAATTNVAAGARISADAIASGNGGKVAVWSDGTTTFSGSISARGGAKGGNGGQIETSGKKTFDLQATAKVDTSAPNGKIGSWLLDPENLVIGPTVATMIENAAADVAIDASGDVDVATELDPQGSLGIEAGGNITLGANIDLTKSASQNLFLVAGGSISQTSGTITLDGGTLSLSAGSGIGTSGAAIATAGAANVAASTSTGGIFISNTGSAIAVSSTGAATIDAGSGATETDGKDDGSSANPIKEYGGTSSPLVITTADLLNTSVGFGALTGLTAATGDIALTDASGINLAQGITGGSVTLTGPVTLTSDLTIDTSSANGAIDLAGTVDGNHALTLDAGVGQIILGGAVGGSISLSSLSVTGAVTLDGGSVTTAGGQSYSGAVALGADTVLTDTKAGAIAFGGAVTGAYTLTTKTGGTTTFNGVDVSSLGVTGATDIAGGNITTTGDQTYTGAVTLGATTALDAGSSGAIAFGSTIDGPFGLTTSAGAGTTFGGSATLASLSVTGAATLDGGSITTTGNQTYAGAVTLGADTMLDSSSGNGAIALGAVTGDGHTLGLESGSGAIQLAAVSGVSGLTASGGQVTLGGDITAGAVDLSQTTGEKLAASVAIDTSAANGAIALAAVDATTTNGQGLTLKAGSGNITVSGDVGGKVALGALTVTSGGAVAFNGTDEQRAASLDVTASTSTSFAGRVTLSDGAMLEAQAGDVSFQHGLKTGAASSFANTGTLQLGSVASDSSSISGGLTHTAGNTTLAGTVASPSMTLGATTLAANTTLDAGTGAITFDNAVNGPYALTTTGGTTTFAVGATVGLTSLSVTGAAELDGGSIRTAGGQTYSGAVTLGADTVLSDSNAGAITFGGTIDGGHALTTATTGTTTFGGAANLASLSVSGDAKLDGDVTTTGSQTYSGGVTLGGNVALSTTDSLVTLGNVSGSGDTLTVSTGTGGVTFNGLTLAGLALTTTGTETLNSGTYAIGGGNVFGSASIPVVTNGTLTLTAPTTFDGAVTLGSNTVLEGAGGITFTGTVNGGYALTVDGPAVLAGGNITTAGGQTYSGAVTLGADTVLTDTKAGAITFDSTVDGGHALTTATTGTTTFGGAADLASLSVGGGAQLDGGSIITAGGQSYSGAVALGADTVLTDTKAGAIAFGGAVTGAYTLTTKTGGTTTFNGVDVSSLGVTGATDIAGGNITTSGDQTYTGAVTLGAATKLDAGSSGAIAFGSTIDGPFGLTTSAGAGTTFGGSATLASLSVTGAATLDGGSITTTGNQTYAGAVTLGADTTLDSSSGNGAIALASVDGTTAGGQGLSLAAGTGAITVSGDVGGTTALGALSVTTSKSTSFAGQVTLTGGATLASGAGDVAFQHGLTTGAGSTSSFANTGTLRLGSTASDSSSISGGLTHTAGDTILAGTVTTPSAALGATTLAADTKLDTSASNGAIALASVDGTTAGGQGLNLMAGTGAITVSGDIGGTTALGALSVTSGGTVAFEGAGQQRAASLSVTTSKSTSFAGHVTLTGGATLASGAGEVAFQHGLTTGAASSFDNTGTLQLGSVASDTSSISGGLTHTAGNTILAGTVTTPAASFRAATLAADTTLTSPTISFAGALGGMYALTDNGATTFLGPVSIASLTDNGTTDLNGGAVTTSGAQTYNGAVTLSADATLAASSILFAETVAGPFALTDTGATTFKAPVNLASLTDNGPTAIDGGSVTTSGAQAYQGTVTLGNDTLLSASSILFGGALTGPVALTNAGPVAFFGPVTVAALTDESTTDLNGGSVTTEAPITGTISPTRNGTQTYDGAVTLSADTTVTGSGDINFFSTVGGSFNLSASTPQTITFYRDVTTSALDVLAGSFIHYGSIPSQTSFGKISARTVSSLAEISALAVQQKIQERFDRGDAPQTPAEQAFLGSPDEPDYAEDPFVQRYDILGVAQEDVPTFQDITYIQDGFWEGLLK